MNTKKAIFEGKWKQIRAQTKGWWSLFSEEDLNKVEKAPIKLDKYAVMLRMKYGYTHEQVREEINKRIAGLDLNPPAPELLKDSPARLAEPKISIVRNRRIKKAKSFSDANFEIE